MGWQSKLYPFDFGFTELRAPVGAFSVNEQCFIRKEHKCGKVFGASKSCFIACPTQDDIEPILNLMSEKLMKSNIEPIIAVKERAYGQDIFCTKICGKIIESRFCVVILDDEIKEGKNIPNPNVYYEYGLMTSIRKHIIPLQKESLSLAFNIQSYDTIKYNNKNIASELDRAIRDAIRITETHERKPDHISMSDKAVLRRLEISGFEEKDDKWFLSDVINDTNFKGFGYHNFEFYVYLGKIDDENEIEECTEDINVVIYRTENKIKELQEKQDSTRKKIKRLSNRKEPITTSSVGGQFKLLMPPADRELREAKRELETISGRLETMEKVYMGFILNPKLDQKQFASRVLPLFEGFERYETAFSDGAKISLGDINVNLSSSGH